MRSCIIDLIWGAPSCLRTYSIQNIAVSKGERGLSWKIADFLFTTSRYLKKKEFQRKYFYADPITNLSPWKCYYLGFTITSLIVSSKVSEVKVLKSSLIPYPALSACFMFAGWSPKIGIPITGTPLSTASVVLRCPPCVINNLRFGCAKKKKKIVTFNGEYYFDYKL